MRVLAAALMTGAIGFALAMPALFGTGHDAGRSLTAPPSFLQRSVHVVASAPSGSAGTGRLDKSNPLLGGVFLPVARSGATADGGNLASTRHPNRAGESKVSKPPPKPATPSLTPTPAPTPAPAAAPDTRGLASNTTPAAVVAPAPSRPAEKANGGKGKGKGKAHQKNKDKGGKGVEPTQAAVPATTPQPANESPPAEGEKDHGRDKNKDKDKDKDKGKGKSDDKGRNG